MWSVGNGEIRRVRSVGWRWVDGVGLWRVGREMRKLGREKGSGVMVIRIVVVVVVVVEVGGVVRFVFGVGVVVGVVEKIGSGVGRMGVRGGMFLGRFVVKMKRGNEGVKGVLVCVVFEWSRESGGRWR